MNVMLCECIYGFYLLSKRVCFALRKMLFCVIKHALLQRDLPSFGFALILYR